MELLTIQHIGDAAPRHIITACEDTDTCPSCGAGYRVGLSECEYCRVPVHHAEWMTMGSDASIEGWDDITSEGEGLAIGGGSSD